MKIQLLKILKNIFFRKLSLERHKGTLLAIYLMKADTYGKGASYDDYTNLRIKYEISLKCHCCGNKLNRQKGVIEGSLLYSQRLGKIGNYNDFYRRSNSWFYDKKFEVVVELELMENETKFQSMVRQNFFLKF